MGGEYSLCSRVDEWGADPVMDQPSVYYRAVREQHLRELMR